MIRNIFYCDTAKKYHPARNKTSSILNAVASYFKDQFVSLMIDNPFSMAIDGGHDSGLTKINPVSIRIFVQKTDRVQLRFYDMCTTTGRNLHTSDTIFSTLLDLFLTSQIPLINCVPFYCDNASVNLGKHHSIMTSVSELNPSIYFLAVFDIELTKLPILLQPHFFFHTVRCSRYDD